MKRPKATGQVLVPSGALWAKRLAALLALAVLGAASYIGVVLVQRSIVFTRIGLVDAAFRNLADALEQYRTDTDAFLPWRMTEAGPELNVDFWGVASPDVIAHYLPFDISDPFAPIPGRPIRYWADQDSWTIWSAGPNRRYELADPKDYAFPGPSAQSHLLPFQYDPSNGLLSAGDLYFLYRPAPEGGP